jgi:leucyl aminopeptidase
MRRATAVLGSKADQLPLIRRIVFTTRSSSTTSLLPRQAFDLKRPSTSPQFHVSKLTVTSRVPRRHLAIMNVSSSTARAGQSVCFPRAASSSVQSLVEPTSNATVTTIECISKGSFDSWLASQSTTVSTWVTATQFKGKDGEICVVPSSEGGIDRVICGVDNPEELWAYAGLPSKLPAGTYSLTGTINANSAALGWALGTYSFDRYKSKKEDSEDAKSSSKEDSPKQARLTWPEGADRSVVSALAQGFYLARDMVTTPAEDMTPQDIAAEAVQLAATHGATSNVIVGDDLLTENFPAIHMVGRASINPPHLVDLRWSPKGTSSSSSLPKVTLVGKGVSFDTGGLDLKPASAMKLMKKDMGGSALILALAHTIMATGLPVSLRVLIPTVENSVSGNAYRPLDVLQTRAGITVENGNTDAEGRLILCDALAEAVKENPEIIIDAATLTGAARVALGTELPALFCNDDAVADDLIKAAREVNDPLWRMPLHQPYRKMLDSKVADIYSCSEGGYGGAITAALFLQEFVKDAKDVAWVHIDTMGYNNSSKPGRPEGGEAYALRGLFEFLQRRYKK